MSQTNDTPMDRAPEGVTAPDRPTEPPTIDELRGSVPDLTQGMASDEWVRRYREGYDAGYVAALQAPRVNIARRIPWALFSETEYQVEDALLSCDCDGITEEKMENVRRYFRDLREALRALPSPEAG